jgi:hypothetical protein
LSGRQDYYREVGQRPGILNGPQCRDTGTLGRFSLLTYREPKLKLNERFAPKSSTEKEATLIPVDDHALLNHATTGSGRDMVTFSAGPSRLRSARLARNSANIQHAPIAARL